MIGLQQQATQIISDWLYLQRKDWSKKTPDHNKGLKDRPSWSIPHISEAQLAEWVEESYRNLLNIWTDFSGSNDQEVSTRQQTGRFTALHAFLVLADYFSAISKCSLSNGDQECITKCVSGMKSRSDVRIHSRSYP